MKIRTQLIITLLLFVILLVVGAASAFITENQITKASDQANISNDVAQGANDLAYLANNYLIYQESQQFERWQSRLTSFSNDVDKLHGETSEQKALILNIQTNTQQYIDVFENIKSGLGSPSLSQNASAVSSSLQLSWSRMAVQSQGLVTSASMLSQFFNNQENYWRRINTIVIIVIIGVFVAYFLINFFIIQRRSLNSIARLRAGTAVIGSGNLDFKIDEKAKDEIGDLSRAFNRMTADLQTITTSKTELESTNRKLEEEINERKKAEDELRGREERFKILLENLRSGVALIDDKGQFITYNSSYLRMFGLSQESSILSVNSQNWSAWQVYDEDGKTLLPVDEHPVRKSALTGHPVRNKLVGMRLPAGSELIWMLINAEPILKPDGSIQYLIATYYDITPRKEAEDKLQETRELLEKAQRISHLGSWEWNIITGELKWSRELYAIYGVDPKSFVPSMDAFADFIHPADREFLNKVMNQLMTGGRTISLDFRIILQDSSIRYVHTTSEISTRDSSGKPVVYVGTTQDITERKQIEEALQRYNQELETYRNHLEDLVNQRTQELQALSRRLISAQEEERRNISRELHDQTGQSLTVLNLLLAKAQKSPDTCLSDIKEAQQKGKEVLSQVRALSTSLHPGMLEDLGLLPTLQWYLNDFGKKTGINVNFASDLERNLLAEINISVYRIIQEALTNIARYAEVKEAAVALKLDHQVLSIRIEDKGKGFAVESQPQGVGLRGMRERVNALKGNLKINSAPGEGTLIEVELPVPNG